MKEIWLILTDRKQSVRDAYIFHVILHICLLIVCNKMLYNILQTHTRLINKVKRNDNSQYLKIATAIPRFVFIATVVPWP